MIKVIEDVKNIGKTIKHDIEAVEKRDPASRGKLEIVLTNQGIHAIWSYRRDLIEHNANHDDRGINNIINDSFFRFVSHAFSLRQEKPDNKYD